MPASNSLSLQRNTHLLGAKIRSLRKGNGLTLEELSARCIQVEATAAPSVSYLSMIERGRRVPSPRLLALLAKVFDREVGWFLDENLETAAPTEGSTGGRTNGLPLEPAFLFSPALLQAAIPELLSQTGTTGRQFAQLLIRSHQEANQNRFPDLERAAEETGGRHFPMQPGDLQRLYRRHGLRIRWFDQAPTTIRPAPGQVVHRLLRSFYERPGTVYVNRLLERDTARLRYDLAGHLGHRVLHGGDGLRSGYATGAQADSSAAADGATAGLATQDMLYAWRDFECSFFAGALLCPKQPFRRFLAREQYDVMACEKLDLSPSVLMRRMTAVSPYRHWHYFDAYPPGRLRAVYRGNGIPLPWGNMTMVSDPCPQWAVFRMLGSRGGARPFAQISLLEDQDRLLLYACLSMRTRDAARNAHVISVGVDLAPALRSQGADAEAVIAGVAAACRQGGGTAMLPPPAAERIAHTARVLNIAWIEQGLAAPARIICPRSSTCPRGDCQARRPAPGRERWVDDSRRRVLGSA